MNLIDHIGNKVNVWTKEGNAMENRTLITADEMGVVFSPYSGDAVEVFVPWNRVKYIDLIKLKCSCAHIGEPSVRELMYGPDCPIHNNLEQSELIEQYAEPIPEEINGFADK